MALNLEVERPFHREHLRPSENKLFIYITIHNRNKIKSYETATKTITFLVVTTTQGTVLRVAVLGRLRTAAVDNC